MIQQVHEENWMITREKYVIWKQAGRQNGEMESHYPQLCSAACLYAFYLVAGNAGSSGMAFTCTTGNSFVAGGSARFMWRCHGGNRKI